MRRSCALLLFACMLQTVALANPPAVEVAEVAPRFAATKDPVSSAGVRSVVDLPAAQHMRNSGGNDRNKDNPRGEPGKGYGLCVFTSIEIMSRWLNLMQVSGFQKWMESKPGGGFPQKVDQMLSAFCKEKGVEVPDYVQHTGGDDSFLDLAVSTGRGVCVTYAGFDGFYRNRAGQDVWIDHMVVLAHLDADNAAIIDNNRPGSWVWMSRKDFLVRWRARGGGWAFVFLGPPPPPHLLSQMASAAGDGCVCEGNCQCKPGECPGKCPVLIGQFRRQSQPSSCPDGKCNLKPQTVPSQPNPFGPVYPQSPATVPQQMPAAPVPVEQLPVPARLPTAQDLAQRPGPAFLWRDTPGVGVGWILPSSEFDWGWNGNQWGWVPKVKMPAAEAEQSPDLVGENYGVVRDKIHQRPTFSINGVQVSEEVGREALGGLLTNDADRWHLTAVGDAAFLTRVKADVAALDPSVRSKLHTQTYTPSAWPTNLFHLPDGVSLRKPATARRSEQVGELASADYSPAKLAELLDLMNGPKPKPTPVKPVDPDGKPVDPANPEPQPDLTWVFVLVGGAVLVMVLSKGR